MDEAVPIRLLRVGARLQHAVFDPANPRIKLLTDGTEITSDFVERLQSRGVKSVTVTAQDAARMLAFQPQGANYSGRVDRDPATCDRPSAVAERLDTEATLEVAHKGASLQQRLQPRAGAYEADHMESAADAHEANVDRLNAVYTRGSSITQQEIDSLTDVCDDAIERALEDLDLFSCLGINPRGSTYPARHSMHVAAVATAMGVLYGLDRPDLSDLALGCLLHDVGMLRVPGRPDALDYELSVDEFAPIAEHPLLTLDAIGDRELPQNTLFVIYQMHERCDGSGYPRGRQREEIHELAKLAAIADVFVALTAPRPYRGALMPHFAISRLLAAVKKGALDAEAMRSLLQAVSLFPLGSYIELQDDQVARVIRANHLRFDRPVVELWNKNHLDAEPRIVDLAEQDDLRILRPLPALS